MHTTISHVGEKKVVMGSYKKTLCFSFLPRMLCIMSIHLFLSVHPDNITDGTNYGSCHCGI